MWCAKEKKMFFFLVHFSNKSKLLIVEGGTAIGIRCTGLWNYVELFRNSLDNAPSSIVFYLEMKVGVHDIRSRFTPRCGFLVKHFMQKNWKKNELLSQF